MDTWKIEYFVFVLVLTTSFTIAAGNQQNDLVCGNSIHHRGFIIYGDSFQRGTFPWVVALLTNKVEPLSFICGGTLVSLQHVVTAAHCIKPKKGFPFAELHPNEIIAYVGAHNLKNDKETRITVSPIDININSDWNPDIQRYDADIAILVFENGKIQYTKFIQPICLWMSDDELSEKEGIVAGWGQSEDLSKFHESIPKQVKLRRIPSSDCFYDAPTLATLASNRTFCAGSSNGSGVCVGDSGNGFFVLSKNIFHLAGIVSSSVTTATSCDVTKNAIYTDVSKFKTWINETLTKTSNTSSGEGRYCKLPNTTEQAICMRIRHCDSLFTFVREASKHTSKEQRAYVEQYICGNKLVCCPDNVVARRNLIRFDGVPEANDLTSIKNHPNYEAINDKRCGRVYSVRFIGGRRVEAGEFPWMALLQYKVGLDELLIFNCGGSLISVNYILTAASCINEDLVSVRLGQLVLSTSSTNKDCVENPRDCDDPIQNISVERQIVHPRYDPVKKINNVALLKLLSPANIKISNVKTICLPTSAEDQFERHDLDQHMLISGYGVKGERSKFPLKTNVHYLSTRDCADRLSEKDYNVYVSNFCGAATMDASAKCPGNKGGSIHSVIEFRGKFKSLLYGILSHGVDCEKPIVDYTDIYTNVTYYLPWILDNMS